MQVNEKTREYGVLRDLLGSDERVGVEVAERRLGGARPLGPAHAYATNKRIIIIRNYRLWIHKTIKILKYDNITETRLERGALFCKLHFSLIGEQAEREENLKWLVGLRYKDALGLIEYVHMMEKKAGSASGNER